MNVCIVSAFYKIPSKQSYEFYIPHLKHFFSSIKLPLIFFTTKEVENDIHTWGYDLNHVQFYHIEFDKLEAYNRWGMEFWERQLSRDPEKYHTKELGVIWYEKKEFVKRAMSLSNASIFIWCDAGCIRSQTAVNAALQFGTRTVELDDGRLHVQKIRTVMPQETYRFPTISIAGAIQAGNRHAWEKHYVLYDKILKEYDTRAVSGISDQYITLTCVDREPNNYMFHSPPRNTRIDEWFFFLSYL